MQDNLDNFQNEEINKSIQKIKNLFHYGIQQSSTAWIPEEKTSTISLHISLEAFYQKAKEAEKEFDEVLANIMEQRQLPQYLFKILQEQKHETALLLKQYNSIILELSKNLNEYDKEYKQKWEKHSSQHELLKENIENLIAEINRIGKEEIENLRVSIIQSTKNKTEAYWGKCQNLLDESAANIAFDDSLWKSPTTMLPMNDLVNVFLPKKKIVVKRRKMLSRICELRKNFEQVKLKHALQLEKLEKELFEVEEGYKRKKLQFAKLKRKQNALSTKKEELSKELKDVMQNIEKEFKTQQKGKEKYGETKNIKCHLQSEQSVMYECILNQRYTEAHSLLADITYNLKFIIENVLEESKVKTNLKGFEVCCQNNIQADAIWMDLIKAAPNSSLLEKVLKIVEDYWYHRTELSDSLVRKMSLKMENKEFQTLLKHYCVFKKSPV